MRMYCPLSSSGSIRNAKVLQRIEKGRTPCGSKGNQSGKAQDAVYSYVGYSVDAFGYHDLPSLIPTFILVWSAAKTGLATSPPVR